LDVRSGLIVAAAVNASGRAQLVDVDAHERLCGEAAGCDAPSGRDQRSGRMRSRI
jgi:hypothetical protein